MCRTPDLMMSTLNISKLIHLDLKGAPPKLTYLDKILPLFKAWGATGLLVEWEDTFPYWGELSVVPAAHAYSFEEVMKLNTMARALDLDVVPLVQTFGHLEFILKHSQFSSLREVPKYPTSLCPTNPDSLRLMTQAIDQMLQLHPNVTHFHIGADEVFHIGVCPSCKERLARDNLTIEKLFLSHLKYLATHIRHTRPHIVVIAWDDMFRSISSPTLRESGISAYVEPMVWHYQSFLLSPHIWDTYYQCFPNIWFASAFKGATGAFTFATDITFHIDNHVMWLSVLQKEKGRLSNVRGIAFTGWQRYDHYAILCELLPQALPSLAICIETFSAGSFSSDILEKVSSQLKFTEPVPLNPFVTTAVPECSFPGSGVYQAMLHFVILAGQYTNFIHSERVIAWMNDYNVNHNHTNPLHLEPLLEVATQLLSSFQFLHTNLASFMAEIYPAVCIDEWLHTFLSPKISQLQTIVSGAQRQISLWTTNQQPMTTKCIAMDNT